MSDKPKLVEVQDTWYQPSDNCQDQDDGQQLVVWTQDGGGGNFLCIKTDRWAIDADGIDEFCEMLKGTIARADKHPLT